MKDVHCNPEEAVRIHEDIGAKQSAAIHWGIFHPPSVCLPCYCAYICDVGTFPLADEDCVEPALELARVRDMQQMPFSEFFTMAHGETLSLGDAPRFDLATVRSDLYGLYLDTLRKAIALG